MAKKGEKEKQKKYRHFTSWKKTLEQITNKSVCPCLEGSNVVIVRRDLSRTDGERSWLLSSSHTPRPSLSLLTAPQLPRDHPTAGQEDNPPMPPHQRVGVPRGCARGWAGSASPLAKPTMGWRRSLPNLQAVQTGCKILQGTGLGFKWILIKWRY